MNQKKFAPEGIYCAMCTPYNRSGAVDYEAIYQIIDFLVDKGVNGVFPVGNIGEFIALDTDVKKRIIAAVIERGRGKLRIIPGINDFEVDRSIELARFCKEVGADGVVLSAPYYYSYPVKYIHKYITTVADACPLPLILYNSPSFTNNIGFENLIAICKHGNITAIKESSGDLKFLLKLAKRLEDENLPIKILMGWDELVLSGLAYGANGCIIATGGIVPEILIKLYHAYKSNDYRTALHCQKAVATIAEAAMKLGLPHGYKLAVLARGFHFNIYPGTALQDLEEELKSNLPNMQSLIDKQLLDTGCR